jgi:hypothetical protein
MGTRARSSSGDLLANPFPSGGRLLPLILG